MRSLLVLSLSGVAALMLAGCASAPAGFTDAPGIGGAAPPPGAPAAHSAGRTMPDDTLAGRVVSVNTRGQFAILNFPITRMPPVDMTLFVYRDGRRIGEVRVSGPQKDDNIVADIITGEARTGDEVRMR